MTVGVRRVFACAAVVCADLDEAGARDAAAAVEKAGGRALAQRVDVTQSADARAAVAAAERAFGGLDVLVFGAATREPSATVAAMDEADWNRTIAVNLTGTYRCTRAVLPAMIERRRRSPRGASPAISARSGINADNHPASLRAFTNSSG